MQSNSSKPKIGTENQESRIERQTLYWGMKFDIDDLYIYEDQVQIADKYAELYCRHGKCQFNYACCRKCTDLTPTGCKNQPNPDICRVFFCDIILRKIPEVERKKLNLEFLLEDEE